MTNDNSRVKQWTPPPRPEWVRRVNEEGRCLDIKGIVPLDAASLIATAQANTGLADFGTDDWREPFERFLKSLNEEADLNLMGRKHPEIESEVIAKPILIVGSGRSGTSAMLNLLAHDPDNGTPKTWEALFPAPAPETATYHSDPRIAIADKRITQWNRVAPEMDSIHEWGGEIPTELIHIEAMSFQADGWLVFCGITPSFTAWLM
jgi:hypothetical protein